jgi:aminoglycoside phosphotransferase (APT) family kinase protein
LTDSQEFSGTMAVREPHRFDAARLEGWLAEHVPGFRGPLTVEQFKGGQSNPTYLLGAPSGRYVLRRKPPGKLLPSAHAVDREYRVMAALAGSGVPVPRVFGLCPDEGVIGTAFFVMDFVAGRVLWDQTLPGMAPAERAAIFDAMNDVIAKLHRVDYASVGLSDFGKTGGYVARQIARWTKQYRASETESIPAMERLIEWLPAHLPPTESTGLVHGDYRLDNLIFHPSEPSILAVLDWELATLGDPLADFAYHVMYWRLAPGLFRGLDGVDLAALGIPTEADYVAAYCQRTGRRSAGRTHIDHWDFYVAYNMFRLAAILQGIMGRVRDGTAASAQAADAGLRARAVADAGWRQVENMGRAA